MAGKHYADESRERDRKDHRDRMKSYEHGEDHNVSKPQGGKSRVGPNMPEQEGGDLITPDLMAIGFEGSQMSIPEVANDYCASSVKGSFSYSFGRKNSYGDDGGHGDHVQYGGGEEDGDEVND